MIAISIVAAILLIGCPSVVGNDTTAFVAGDNTTADTDTDTDTDTDHELVEGQNLVANEQWTQHTDTDASFSRDEGVITYEITTLGTGQWDDQLMNEVQISEPGDYIVRFTASSNVDRDILFRVDGIELQKSSTDVIASLTDAPQEFMMPVTVTPDSLAGNPRLKIVLALGTLEANGTTSAAAKVNFNSFYLGKSN